MSCSSCNNNVCTCDNYILPTGAAGATGPQGPAGPQGSPGSTILFNESIGVSNTITGIEVLGAGYTTTSPGPLVNAGDELEVIIYISRASVQAVGTLPDTFLSFSYGSTTSMITPLPVPFILGTQSAIIKTRISRINATTAFVGTSVTFFPPNIFAGMITAGSIHNTISVPNLDTGNNTIIPIYNTTAVPGTVTLDRMTIILNKI